MPNLFIVVVQVSLPPSCPNVAGALHLLQTQMLQSSGLQPALTVLTGAQSPLPVFSLLVYAAVHNLERVGRHNLPTSGP